MKTSRRLRKKTPSKQADWMNPDYDIRERLSKERPKSVEQPVPQSAQKPQPIPNSSDKKITFEIKLQKPRLPKSLKNGWKSVGNSIKSSRLYTQKSYRYSFIALFTVIIVAIITTILWPSGNRNSTTDQGATHGKPRASYKYLVPLDAQKNDGKVKYSQQTKTVSISDTYMQTNIVLNQQSLDEKSASNPTTLQNAANGIASAFKLTILNRKVVNTTKGDLYYYETGKDGGQRGVFQFNKLLVFVYSDKNIKADDWKDYIDSLQISD